MDVGCIKRAILRGDIELIHEFIDDKAVVKKFANADPRIFYEILSSAITVDHRRLWHRYDSDDLILRLIKAAKKVHFGLFNGKTLLMLAVAERRSKIIIDELIKAGSDVNGRSGYVSPLLFAVRAASRKQATALINRGANVNCRDENGWTVLFHVMRGYDYYDKPVDFIKTLLKAGSNVHDVDYNGRNVLMIGGCKCFSRGDCDAKECMDLLLKWGINDIDLKHTDNDGNTVLHATKCKYVFDLAIKCGVSMEAKNNEGRTPLLKDKGCKRRVDHLLKCGADVCSTDPQLQTALHVYFLNTNRIDSGVLDMLIYHGASMYARNIYNQTPLEMIIKENPERFYVDPTFVLPKHIILFDDNGFNFEKYANEQSDLFQHVFECFITPFLDECKKELTLMRETFIAEGLTFYKFCILKRYYKSKCVNISLNKYKYSCADISEIFPIYKDVIIIRIKDNRLKTRESDFRKLFDKITLSAIHAVKTDLAVVLNYDCLYRISQYLNYEELFNIFSAAVKS